MSTYHAIDLSLSDAHDPNVKISVDYTNDIAYVYVYTQKNMAALYYRWFTRQFL